MVGTQIVDSFHIIKLHSMRLQLILALFFIVISPAKAIRIKQSIAV